jgi:NADH-quinone oxidoreductase subunit M
MTILEIIVLLPIAAAVLIAMGSPARVTALLAAFATLVSSVMVAMPLHFNSKVEGVGNFAFQYFGPEGFTGRKLPAMSGFPDLSLAFGVDGISLVLMLLTAIVLMAALWISPSEKSIKGSSRLYYACCLLIGGGAMGAFLSTDLFFLYAFHELALIPTFLMIGLFGSGENRVKTAWTITIYLGVGSIILLIGLIAVLDALGAKTFDISSLIAIAAKAGLGKTMQMWIYLPLLIGFGILVSLFPFHTWAPNAYADAPTPVAMLHAGVLKKFGLYGLIRVANPLLPQGAEGLTNLLLILLVGNIIILGLVTIAQKRLDKMLGYSSVMHMGYIFLGIASGTYIGTVGAVLLMFAHGISIAVLFALTGALRERFGTLEFSKLGGLARVIPAAGLLFGFAAFASIGLPGFTNFAGEVMIFFGGFKNFTETFSPLQVATMLALWGVVISAVYMLRAFRQVFKGELVNGLNSVKDLTWNERLPILLLLGTLLMTGFVPEILIKYLRPALEGLMVAAGG